MILLENFSGRFGNKFLSYNNVRQIAHSFNQQWYVPSWEGDTLFEKSNNNFLVKNPIKLTTLDFLKSDSEIQEIINKNDVIIDPHVLGSIFFRFVKLNPQSYLINKFHNNHGQVGIHFRGTDFFLWNPKSILSSEYYLNSINVCLDSFKDLEFVLFTDDYNLESFKSVLTFINKNKIKYRMGMFQKTGNFLDDFIDLASCDTIISSPSTFAISAGMIGNSRIIHSKEWIKHRVNENDKFWVDVQKTGTTFYSLWKQI